MIFSFPQGQDGSTAPERGHGMPGKVWYVLALVMFLVCTAGIGIVVYGAVQSFPQGTQFLVPGSLTVKVEQPGTYVLWDELTTFFQGKSYSNSDDLPGGIEINVRDALSGRAVPFVPSSGGSETIGNVKRKAIGDMSFDTPGAYVVEVAGVFPERVFYIRRSAIRSVCSGMAAIALLGVAGWVVAPLVAIIVFARRTQAAREPVLSAAGEKGASGAVAAGMSADEERTYAMFCHLGALSGFFVPLGNIIVPLILWITKRDASPNIDLHGKESLNFQISLLIYTFFSAILILLVVGIFLLAGLWIFNLVIVIIAGVRAKSGEPFRYPLAIRFIK